MTNSLTRKASGTIAVAVVAGFMAMAGSAHAATLSWGSGPSYVPGIGASTAVSVTSGTPTKDYDGWGVAFNVSDDGGTSNFLAWCLDINHTLSIPSDYALTSTPFTNQAGSGVLNSVQKNDLNRLYNTAFLTLDTSNGAQVAGFQLALWEIAFEDNGSPYNITAGDFKSNWGVASTSGQNNAAVSAAAGFLAGLGGAQTGYYAVSFWQADAASASSGHSQNLISAVIDPGGSFLPPVPVPAAGWMLGLGLFGLYGARRRKKA